MTYIISDKVCNVLRWARVIALEDTAYSPDAYPAHWKKVEA